MLLSFISGTPLKGNYDDSNSSCIIRISGLLMLSLDEEAQEDLRANKILVFIKELYMRILWQRRL